MYIYIYIRIYIYVYMYIYIYIYIYIVADTRSAIRNDQQRPLTSGIGVQESRDLSDT